MTTITIKRALLEEVVEIFDNSISTRYPHQILSDIRAVLAAPATAPDELERLRTESEERLQNCAALVAENERLRKDAERKPITDEDTLALFNRIQTGMRFTDAAARPFAAGVAAAEFFHKIKGTP